MVIGCLARRELPVNSGVAGTKTRLRHVALPHFSLTAVLPGPEKGLAHIRHLVILVTAVSVGIKAPCFMPFGEDRM